MTSPRTGNTTANELRCCLYGCDKPAAIRRLDEIDGTGRTGWRHYCAFHADYYGLKGLAIA